jgi:hypothetical protein
MDSEPPFRAGHELERELVLALYMSRRTTRIAAVTNPESPTILPRASDLCACVCQIYLTASAQR